jgi:hypothetical protein
LSADLAFEFAALPDGNTQLTQNYVFHQPDLMVRLFKLIYGPDLDQKGYAQWQSGLQNIKHILEHADAASGHATARNSYATLS